MSTPKLFAALLVSALVAAPAICEAHGHHRHHHRFARVVHLLPYQISYLHNYGPGIRPGSFAYYDGPSTNHCYQSAAAYIGQDRRRHPCQ